MWRHAVLLLFSLVSCAFASRMRIVNAGCPFDDVPDGQSGALTYYFPEETGPATVNCSAGSLPRCNQTLQNHLLSGRSWYMTQDKMFFGRGYNPWFFQNYNIECPAGHYLHLSMQELSLICDRGGAIEGVTVITTPVDTGRLCTRFDLMASDLYNGGNGIFVEDGKARVDFCSDDAGSGEGFVLRGTCIDPVLYYNGVGCVSYDFWRAWDPFFVNSLPEMFEMVNTTVVPHKRSAEESSMMSENMREKMKDLKAAEREVKALKENINRVKRGQRTFFTFEEGTTVMYINSMLMFMFEDGSPTQSFPAFCLTASNDLYGTRFYSRNATRQVGDTTGATKLTFTGPGWVDIVPTSSGVTATMFWTPQPDFKTVLEADVQQSQIAERIYDYIYNEWVRPYVVIDEIAVENASPKPFPLFGVEDPRVSRNIRKSGQIDVVFPEIQEQEGSKCRAVLLVEAAPLRTAKIDLALLHFCSFFQRACSPILATACREIMRLDPFDTDPLTRVMMMMGPGDR